MNKTVLYITATLLLASSCNEMLMEPQQMGSIDLSLSSEREVLVDTKAESVDCSNFLVDITGETFLGQPYASDQYIYSEITSPLVIPYGYYYVSAQNCLETTAEQGFGEVRYYGISNKVDVLSKDVASVTVNCKMVNGKVTLTLDESFLSDFSDPSAQLIIGDRTVNLTAEQADGSKDVYFNLPAEGAQLIYKVMGTVGKGTAQEREVTYSNASSPITLQPAKWAKILVKSNHNGLIGPDITVGDGMGNQIYTEILQPEGGVDHQEGDADVSILVDTQLDDATVIDCVIDVL